MNERPTLRSAGRLRRAVTVTLLALVGTIGLAGLLPGTAHAENSLVSSDPADGSTLAVSPESISFTFSEPLGEVNTITLTCTDLFTVGPREVSADRLTMTAEVVDALPKGACVASFVVSDEEGSPNGQGNITFTIENDPATVETTTAPEETTGDSVPTGEVSTTSATSTDDVADLSDVDSGQGPLWLGRLLSVFGIAVLLGSLVLIAAAWPEGVEYLVTIRFIRAIWIVALIGTLLYVAAATAAVTGSGLGSGFNPANWVDLFDAGLPGIAAVARFVLVVACAWVAFRPDRVIDPVTQMAALGIPALAAATVGFSRTNMDLAIVAVPVSIIHALAMSVWLGGVVLLARVVLAGPGEEDLVHAVRGFTRLSNLAIGATIVTGIVQMILLDGGDLFGTSHGRVLLLKTVAVAGMIFVAVSARQFVNQRLARANEMTVPMADRLRRAFGVEAAVGIIVLAMSAWLLSLAPSNVSAGPDIDYAISLEVDAPEAELALTIQLTRDRVGLSGMSVDVDEPDEGLSGLEVVFTAPANDTIGTITQPVPLTGAGVAVLLEGEQGLPLTVAGDWTMTVNAVTPTGIFTSPPQGFTILNADGTEAVTELTVPPAVNVTIPPLTSEP
ncbi:MAG TPA: CopD family protein [Ilumatobacteraceae bacterium]|nr:CopD family protein [Ilumatobacteraceae bacterium]